MRVKIYRGSHEIGGSCIEVTTSTNRIILDAGMPLNYDELNDTEQKNIDDEAERWCEGADAIFISHYHADHTGLLKHIDKNIPVYLSEGTLAAVSVPGKHLSERLRLNNNFITFKSYDKSNPDRSVTVGSIKVTPYTVDHSAFDACALLVEADGKQLLYSGDIRISGRKRGLYKCLPKNIDCLLLEGTNIRKEEDHSVKTCDVGDLHFAKCVRRYYFENEVESELCNLFSGSNKLHYIWASALDIDRIVTIYQACVKTQKTLYIDLYTAAVLRDINEVRNTIPSAETHQKINVYIPKSYRHPNNHKVEELRQNDAKYFSDKGKVVKKDVITQDSGSSVVLVRPRLLRDILKPLKVRDVDFIWSVWLGYRNKNKELVKWLNDNQIPLYFAHTSGHADVESLQKIVKSVSPKAIIPVHTEAPEKFEEVFKGYKILQGADSYDV
jgi:ribonuclease J